jgi:hypothetical protein
MSPLRGLKQRSLRLPGYPATGNRQLDNPTTDY